MTPSEKTSARASHVALPRSGRDVWASQQRIAHARGLERLDDAESRDAREPVFILMHEHVTRVQRAVKNPGIGRRHERRRERAEDAKCPVNRHGHRTAQHDVERLAWLERHHDVRRRALESDVEERHDQRMHRRSGLQPTQRVGEPDDLFRKNLEPEDLDCNEPVTRRIERTKHRAENATAGLVKHAIRAERSRRAEDCRTRRSAARSLPLVPLIHPRTRQS